MVWEIAKVLELKSWLDIAGHLGCSSKYIVNVQSSEILLHGDEGVDRDRLHRFYKRCLVQVSADWAAKTEGTGSMPRTWKTVLEAFKRCCINSEEGRANLSVFKTKLINGTEWVTI